jgi:farnesyl diphosphate synthase
LINQSEYLRIRNHRICLRLQFGVMGRTLHLNLGQSNGGGRLAGFDIQNYKNLIRATITQINFCLPISLALHLANLSDPRIHSVAHSILKEIGYFLQVTRDYVNCYVDPYGMDIKDGRITWLIIVARQRANSSQLATLEQCYGRPDAESVAEVKRIYKELNLKKISNAHMNETRDDIHKQIQQLSKLDDVGLSQEFFFKLIENMNTQQIS